jgi:carbonyl reductase 1
MLSTPASVAIGRIAVVSGANKGIGFFIALQLGLSGLFSHIVLGCRDPTRGLAAVEEIKKQVVGTTTTISYAPLELGNVQSHEEFAKKMEQDYGKVDVLVNNAGLAFKNADPTPFVEQCTPTLNVNYRGTVDFTERMLPLVRKGADPRIVNVASMSGHLSQLKSEELQNRFSSQSLTIPELNQLVDQFESDVKDDTYASKGWGRSNYGLSKLAVIAATRIWARENAGVVTVNSCCPGYCKTDMTSQKGRRDPAEGARNAVMPATMEQPPTGEFFADFDVSTW